MNKEYWLNGWKLGWENEKSFAKTDVRESLKKYFNHLNLQKNATILVPLCGKSIDLLWLSQQPINVIGVELSEVACISFLTQHKLPYERKQINKFSVFTAKNIALWCGDFFDFSECYSQKIDAIYDSAALVALPPEMQQNYINYLATLCKPNSRILLNAFEADFQSCTKPPFPIDNTQINRMYSHLFTVNELTRTSVLNIPAHLAARGCQSMVNVTYLLEKPA